MIVTTSSSAMGQASAEIVGSIHALMAEAG
jgi:hypothetical protein